MTLSDQTTNAHPENRVSFFITVPDQMTDIFSIFLVNYTLIAYNIYVEIMLRGIGNIMSKKAYLLTQNDVPQYIRKIVQRLHPVLMEFEDEDGNWWGYTF